MWAQSYAGTWFFETVAWRHGSDHGSAANGRRSAAWILPAAARLAPTAERRPQSYVGRRLPARQLRRVTWPKRRIPIGRGRQVLAVPARSGLRNRLPGSSTTARCKIIRAKNRLFSWTGCRSRICDLSCFSHINFRKKGLNFGIGYFTDCHCKHCRSWLACACWLSVTVHRRTPGIHIYMSCSDVIIITRRHVWGIPNMNTNWVKMRKSENSYAKVIRRRFIFHSPRFASLYVMFMTLHRCNKYTSKMAGGDCCRHNDVTANLPACLYSQCVHVYKKYHLWYHRNHHTAIFLVTFIHWSNYGRGPERDLGIRGTEVGKGICGCIQWRIQGGAPFSLLALNCVYKPPFPV